MATYVPDATIVTEPADVGVLASSAAAEFRTVKLYMRDVLLAGVNARAPIASPTFTGVPAAPTAAVDTNTTQLATTAYVIGQGYLKSATAASTYAPLASPALTGNPTAPTQSAGNNSTRIASTAFVTAAIAAAAPPAGATNVALTVTNLVNMSSSSAECIWSRAGDIVTMSGNWYINSSAAGAVSGTMQLPVASNFPDGASAFGVVIESNSTFNGLCLSDATNDRILMQGVAAGASGLTARFTLQYKVYP